jgi:hypothetical protein
MIELCNMRIALFFILMFFVVLLSCTKKRGLPPKNEVPVKPVVVNNSCIYQSNSVISYSATVSPMLMSNCYNCHSSPSAFSCDSYEPVKASAQSGNLMLYATNTDTNSPIMPPPPYRHLDSCQIKALTLWIAQGCLNN